MASNTNGHLFRLAVTQMAESIVPTVKTLEDATGIRPMFIVDAEVAIDVFLDCARRADMVGLTDFPAWANLRVDWPSEESRELEAAGKIYPVMLRVTCKQALTGSDRAGVEASRAARSAA